MELKELIKECIHEVAEETMQRQVIREIVKKELRRMYNEGVFEGGKPKNKNEKDKETQGATDTARGQLKNILDNNPLIKKSQIAYKLHPGVDHDSARHIFQDQISGDDPLSTQEVNTAIDFIHNAQI